VEHGESSSDGSCEGNQVYRPKQEDDRGRPERVEVIEPGQGGEYRDGQKVKQGGKGDDILEGMRSMDEHEYEMNYGCHE
jgi:hypothetical protein